MTTLYCLAMLIYFEARSEPIIGQYAVAEVVINRLNHPSYPKSVCGVVHEDRGPKPRDCQFSFTCDGKPENFEDQEAYEIALDIAADVLNGHSDVTDGALYFLSKNYRPKWVNNVTMTTRYGNHVFYK